MCVNAHVARRPSQTLVLPVWDVFFGLGVYIFFGQTKVNDVDGVLPLASGPPDEEVLGFYISVDQTLGVHILHPCYLVKAISGAKLAPGCQPVWKGGVAKETRFLPHSVSDHRYMTNAESESHAKN